MMYTVMLYFDYSRRYYLFEKLTRQLSAGHSYCVSFYVNLIEASNLAVADIGAYLDDGSIDTNHKCGQALSQYTPQIQNTSGVITDTGKWTKISGSFIATGKEKYITIGNFKDSASTTYTTIPPNAYNGRGNAAAYLVDDVSVVESGTKANAGPDTHVGLGDSVFIGISDLAIDCSWTKFGSSTIIGTTPGIWVKPTVATSYVVTQNLCGTITKDTVKVDVWKLGVTSINGQTQQYSLSPNPNSGAFTISQSVANDESSKCTVYNVVGQKVWGGSIYFKEGKAALGLQTQTVLPAGLYYLHLTDATGNKTMLRFVRQ